MSAGAADLLAHRHLALFIPSNRASLCGTTYQRLVCRSHRPLCSRATTLNCSASYQKPGLDPNQQAPCLHELQTSMLSGNDACSPSAIRHAQHCGKYQNDVISAGVTAVSLCDCTTSCLFSLVSVVAEEVVNFVDPGDFLLRAFALTDTDAGTSSLSL